MEKIGLSFRSQLSADEVRDTYINPLREALKEHQAGIYSNHLRQIDPEAIEPTEHLLVFEVKDFKSGLHLLRMAIEEIGYPQEIQFQNLNPSTPGY